MVDWRTGELRTAKIPTRASLRCIYFGAIREEFPNTTAFALRAACVDRGLDFANSLCCVSYRLSMIGKAILDDVSRRHKVVASGGIIVHLDYRINDYRGTYLHIGDSKF